VLAMAMAGIWPWAVALGVGLLVGRLARGGAVGQAWAYRQLRDSGVPRGGAPQALKIIGGHSHWVTALLDPVSTRNPARAA